MPIGKECASGSTVRQRLAATVAFVMIFLGSMPGAAFAQERPRVAADLALGWVGFADDGIVGEGLVGGAVRWYLLPRLSIGPEVIFIGGQNHSHLVATGNLVWDLFDLENARRRGFTPFLVGGGGIFQTRESFPSGTSTSTEGAFTAGGGVRAKFANRVTAGVDVRVGWELHLRVNGTIGLEWGR